jgi:hypothetical protein
MRSLFASFRGTLAVLALVMFAGAPVFAADQSALPAGGKYKDCHGYKANGKSVQVSDLAPDTPVHVIFTQSLGVRHAYKIFVANPNGRGMYGFKS